jgi:hypothetical protein
MNRRDAADAEIRKRGLRKKLFSFLFSQRLGGSKKLLNLKSPNRRRQFAFEAFAFGD